MASKPTSKVTPAKKKRANSVKKSKRTAVAKRSGILTILRSAPKKSAKKKASAKKKTRVAPKKQRAAVKSTRSKVSRSSAKKKATTAAKKKRSYSTDRKPQGTARKKAASSSHIKKPQRRTATKRKASTARVRARRSTRKSDTWMLFSKKMMKQFGWFGFRVMQFSFVLAVAGLIGLFYYSRDLPSLDILEAQAKPPRIMVLDKDNVVLTRYGQYYGKPVILDELPPHALHAFLATEDRNFYHHLGINPVAILRALMVNMTSGNVQQGGSTITQQLAKNLFLTPERTIKRKAQEMLVAFWLESRYSKDEILTLYLNNVYFGAGAHGIRAAADRYFAKAPADLTVGEAAMLAGLLKAPSRYAPSSNLAAARARAKIVISVMHEAGYISRAKADAVIKNNIADVVARETIAAYAIDHAVAEFRKMFKENAQNILIHTTIDTNAQRRAEAAVELVAAEDPLMTSDIEVAAVAMENDGAIRVLIGGRDHQRSEYNRATQAHRQPGSAFKPFVYLAALEEGYQPEDYISDTPIELEGWKPTNYKDRYYGTVSMTEALSRSLNAAAIRLQENVGRRRVVETARRAGYPGKISPDAALALGVHELTPLELTATYGIFANEGYPVKPYVITAITNEDGDVLYRHQPQNFLRPATDAHSLSAMNHMMRSVVQTGSGHRATVAKHQAAGKTGTTQDSRDAWFAGHASGVTGVVWMGKDDNSPMTLGNNYISGSGAPAKLWSQVMTAALGNRPAEPVIPYEPQPLYDTFFKSFTDLFNGSKTKSQNSIHDPFHDDSTLPEIAPGQNQKAIQPEDKPIAQSSNAPPGSIDKILLDVLGENDMVVPRDYQAGTIKPTVTQANKWLDDPVQ